MIEKQQWTILPASLILNVLGLRLSPLGLVPQASRRDWTISDYSFSGVNADTVPLAPKEAMQNRPWLAHRYGSKDDNTSCTSHSTSPRNP